MLKNFENMSFFLLWGRYPCLHGGRDRVARSRCAEGFHLRKHTLLHSGLFEGSLFWLSFLYLLLLEILMFLVGCVLLVDEGGDLVRGLEETLPHLDEVDKVV